MLLAVLFSSRLTGKQNRMYESIMGTRPSSIAGLRLPHFVFMLSVSAAKGTSMMPSTSCARNFSTENRPTAIMVLSAKFQLSEFTTKPVF